MSLSHGGRLLSVRTPLIQSLRNRTPDIRRKDIPHWKRAVVLELTKPVYKDPNEGKHPSEFCKKQIKNLSKAVKEINPFEEILAKEVFEKIDNAKLVAIFHKYSMTQAGLFAARLQLNKINLQYVHHNNNIMRLAFTGTKYEAVLKLYESETVTFVSDQLNVTKLLKLEKKIRGLLLLGGVLEGRLLSVSELKQYAALPSLDVMQAQVVHTLSSAAQLISQNLVAQQVELASLLGRHIANESTPLEEAMTRLLHKRRMITERI